MYFSSSTSKQIKAPEHKMTMDHIDDRPQLIPIKQVQNKRHSSSSDSSCDESESEEHVKELKTLKSKKKTKTKTKALEKKASCHKYFTLIEKDGKKFDKCNFVGLDGISCKAEFAHHGSTSRMNEHLKNQHDLDDFKSRNQIRSKTEIQDKGKLLVYFVISTASPFSIVEDDFFRELMSEVCEIPNRKAIKQMMLNVYEEMFVSVSSELAKIEFMALTTDGWTSKHQKICFNSCTIHFLNEILESKTINLGIHQAKGHDATLTAIGLKNKLNKFKIYERVNYMAVDNASVMKNVCKNLNKENIGCLNHLLNLIVKRFFNSKIIIDNEVESEDDEEDENDGEDIFLDEVSNLDIDQLQSDDEYKYSEVYSKALKTVVKILKKI